MAKLITIQKAEEWYLVHLQGTVETHTIAFQTWKEASEYMCEEFNPPQQAK